MAPKSVEYPFGDENFNADIREDRVQEESREVNIEIVKVHLTQLTTLSKF